MTDANRARRPSKRVPGGRNAASAGGTLLRLRRAAERRGLRAETIAALWLRLKGYRILAQRVRMPAGEVDIVAVRGDAVVAVEVKARATLEAAVAAVSLRQRLRVARGLEAFLAGHPGLAALHRRFDLVAILPWRLPRHLPDVWRPQR